MRCFGIASVAKVEVDSHPELLVGVGKAATLLTMSLAYSETLNAGHSPVYDDLGDCDQRCQYYGAAFWMVVICMPCKLPYYGGDHMVRNMYSVWLLHDVSTKIREGPGSIHDVPIKDALYPAVGYYRL
ncbi:hypothetical protein Tco_0309572 [Tanacetum coccineum]